MVTIASPEDRRIGALQALEWFAVAGVCISHLPIAFSSPAFVRMNLGFLHDLAIASITVIFVAAGYRVHTKWRDRIRWTVAGGVAGARALIEAMTLLIPVAWLVIVADLLVAPVPLLEKKAAILRALSPSFLVLAQTWFYQVNGDSVLHFSYASANVAWLGAGLLFLTGVYVVISPLLARFRSRPVVVCTLAALLMAIGIFEHSLRVHLSGINEYAVAHFGDMAVEPNLAVPRALSFFSWVSLYAPWARLLEFMVGVLLAEAVERDGGGHWGVAAAEIACLGLGACLYLSARHTAWTFEGKVAAYGVMATGLVLFCGSRIGRGCAAAIAARPNVTILFSSAYVLWMWHLLWYNAYVLPPVDVATPWRVALYSGRFIALGLLVVLTAAGISSLVRNGIARRTAEWVVGTRQP